jgi:hypothetical protein
MGKRTKGIDLLSMKRSKKTGRPGIFKTCILCGAPIFSKESEETTPVCLICQARQLNEHFRKKRTGVSNDPDRARQL